MALNVTGAVAAIAAALWQVSRLTVGQPLHLQGAFPDADFSEVNELRPRMLENPILRLSAHWGIRRKECRHAPMCLASQMSPNI